MYIVCVCLYLSKLSNIRPTLQYTIMCKSLLPVGVAHGGDGLVYGWVHAVRKATVDRDATAAIGCLATLIT